MCQSSTSSAPYWDVSPSLTPDLQKQSQFLSPDPKAKNLQKRSELSRLAWPQSWPRTCRNRVRCLRVPLILTFPPRGFSLYNGYDWASDVYCYFTMYPLPMDADVAVLRMVSAPGIGNVLLAGLLLSLAIPDLLRLIRIPHIYIQTPHT